MEPSTIVELREGDCPKTCSWSLGFDRVSQGHSRSIEGVHEEPLEPGTGRVVNALTRFHSVTIQTVQTSNLKNAGMSSRDHRMENNHLLDPLHLLCRLEIARLIL